MRHGRSPSAKLEKEDERARYRLWEGGLCRTKSITLQVGPTLPRPCRMLAWIFHQSFRNWTARFCVSNEHATYSSASWYALNFSQSISSHLPVPHFPSVRTQHASIASPNCNFMHGGVTAYSRSIGWPQFGRGFWSRQVVRNLAERPLRINLPASGGGRSCRESDEDLMLPRSRRSLRKEGGLVWSMPR
jgi:hypothetical protein